MSEVKIEKTWGTGERIIQQMNKNVQVSKILMNSVAHKSEGCENQAVYKKEVAR